MNSFKFLKFARTLLPAASVALVGGTIAISKMPTKIQAAEIQTSNQEKVSRKGIEDEDEAIKLSFLSVLNRRGKDSPKWDSNWDK